MSIRKFAAITAMGCLSATVLSACSMGGRSDFINHLDDRAAGGDTAELNFQEVFGNKWSKAAVVCPYEDPAQVHAKLGVDSSPMGNRQMAESDNMVFLKSEDGASSWVQFPRKSVDFCQSAKLDEYQALHSAATTMTFDHHDTEGTWVLR